MCGREAGSALSSTLAYGGGEEVDSVGFVGGIETLGKGFDGSQRQFGGDGVCLWCQLVWESRGPRGRTTESPGMQSPFESPGTSVSGPPSVCEKPQYWTFSEILSPDIRQGRCRLLLVETHVVGSEEEIRHVEFFCPVGACVEGVDAKLGFTVEGSVYRCLAAGICGALRLCLSSTDGEEGCRCEEEGKESSGDHLARENGSEKWMAEVI